MQDPPELLGCLSLESDQGVLHRTARAKRTSPVGSATEKLNNLHARLIRPMTIFRGEKDCQGFIACTNIVELLKELFPLGGDSPRSASRISSK